MIDFHLYQVKNVTNWSMVMQSKYTPEQLNTMWKQHQEAREEMAAFKEWMFKRYEAETIHEYDNLVASGGNFDALANRWIDEVWRPGDKEQFRKERAAEQHSRGHLVPQVEA